MSTHAAEKPRGMASWYWPAGASNARVKSCTCSCSTSKMFRTTPSISIRVRVISIERVFGRMRTGSIRTRRVISPLRLFRSACLMGVMDGKRGLIVGIANDHSYAYYIAESLLREGARGLFTHLTGEKMERRCSKAIDQLGVKNPWLVPLDAGSDENLDQAFSKLKTDFGPIAFLFPSIPFADKDWLKDGVFTSTPRQVFTQAMDISA